MNARKLTARALTLLPAVMIVTAGLFQVRAQALRVSASAQPRAVTFLVDPPAPHHARPGRASRPVGRAM